jgi:hypothetical protein
MLGLLHKVLTQSQAREALARRADVVLFAQHAFGPVSLERIEALHQLALGQYDVGDLEESVLTFSSALGLYQELTVHSGKSCCSLLVLQSHGPSAS